MTGSALSGFRPLYRCAMYWIHTEQTKGKYYDPSRDANKGVQYVF